MATSLTGLKVRSIKQTDTESAPAAATLAALIASVAGSDGILTPKEYAAGLGVAEVVAHLSDDPAVVRSLILRAFDGPARPLEALLKNVEDLREGLPEEARRPLFEALFPLLDTQGEQARPLARKIAAALDVHNVNTLLNNCDLPAESGGVTNLLRRAGHAISRKSGKLDIAGEVAQFTGDEDLTRLLRGDRHERDRQLDPALAAAFERLQTTLTVMRTTQQDQADKLEVANSMDRNADELERQFKARLRAVEKRVLMLRRHLTEDIEALSEDGGDEAEVDLRRMSEQRGIMLRNDDRDVRERLVSKALARRYDKLRGRYDEQIQLLRDELSEYRDDFVEAAREAVSPISLADWRLVIPGPTAAARFKDALDGGASRTLGGGAVAAAGTAGAISAGLIAPATVGAIVAAPVGIAVVGVVAAAGVWKLYANRKERLRSEQRDRAEAIRKVAKSKVAEAFSGIAVALDDVAEGFRAVSLSRIAPLRNNAERIREMCVLQNELGRRMSLDAQRRLQQWQQAMQNT